MKVHGDMEAAAADLRSTEPLRVQRGVDRVERLRRSGDPQASYAVGTWLLHGSHGYARDETEAASLMQYAAEHGVADAIYDLGQLAEQRRGARHSRREAFGRYMTAAILGDRDAAYEVVRCVYHGIGTYADRSAAERLHELLSNDQQRPIAAE